MNEQRSEEKRAWKPPKPRIQWRGNDFFRGPTWCCWTPGGLFGGVRAGYGATPAEAYEKWKDWRPYVHLGVTA